MDGVDPFNEPEPSMPPEPPAPAPIATVVRDRINSRASDMLRLAILEELHKTPSLSLTEFFSAADIAIGSMEYEMIMDTPVDELTLTTIVDGKPSDTRVPAPPPRAARRKAPPRAARRRAPPRVDATSTGVEDFVAALAKGDTFKTRVFMDSTSMSQSRALRHLDASKLVKKQGEKRFMVWVVK